VPTEDGVNAVYTIYFTQLFVFAALLMVYFVLGVRHPPRVPAYPVFAAGFLWLFGGNVAIALWRWAHFVRSELRNEKLDA